MTSIEHTDAALDEKEYFCISLKVKQRYINPLVSLSGLTRQSSQTQSVADSRIKSGNDNYRLSEISERGRRIIEDFKNYSDTAYGCVKLV